MTACKDCLEKRKTMPGYTCVLCALGLSMGSDVVVKDPFTGTVYVDLSDPKALDNLGGPIKLTGPATAFHLPKPKDETKEGQS